MVKKIDKQMEINPTLWENFIAKEGIEHGEIDVTIKFFNKPTDIIVRDKRTRYRGEE